jgi:hypothetical protein
MKTQVASLSLVAALVAGCGGGVEGSEESASAAALTSYQLQLGGNQAYTDPAAKKIAVNGSDVWVTYGRATTGGETQVIATHSANGGSSFDGGTIVARGANVNPSAAIAIGVDAATLKKVVHLVWGVAGGADGTGSIYYSNNAGAGWTAPVVVSGSSSAFVNSAAVAADGAGRVNIVYTVASPAGSSSPAFVDYSSSSDSGAGFYVVDGIASAQASTASQASVALDGQGNTFVAWNDNTAGGAIGVSFTWRNTRQFGFNAPTHVGLSYPSSAPTIAVQDTNRLFIGYGYQAASGTPRGVAVVPGIYSTTTFDYTWGASKNVTTSATGNVSFAVASTGAMSIAWDGSSGVLFSKSTGGNSWSAPVTVDVAGRNPSVALSGSSTLFVYNQTPSFATYFSKK